ncbi:MAG TPA: hypothetical protein VMW12_01955 [Candidatus Dormibacteraeota bacterium]|nr:hypothetical protein [Candidatus Dormibacteraeota bacterium]
MHFNEFWDVVNIVCQIAGLMSAGVCLLIAAHFWAPTREWLTNATPITLLVMSLVGLVISVAFYVHGSGVLWPLTASDVMISFPPADTDVLIARILVSCGGLGIVGASATGLYGFHRVFGVFSRMFG